MSDDKDAKDDDPSSAKDELFEAIDHFRNAANILFDKATKDPAVRTATKEAEKVVKKLGDAAEPLARQLTGELGKLTRNMLEAVEGKRKSEAPPPPSADDGEQKGEKKKD